MRGAGGTLPIPAPRVSLILERDPRRQREFGDLERRREHPELPLPLPLPSEWYIRSIE